MADVNVNEELVNITVSEDDVKITTVGVQGPVGPVLGTIDGGTFSEFDDNTVYTDMSIPQLLNHLNDVSNVNPSVGEILRYDGTDFINTLLDYTDLSNTPTSVDSFNDMNITGVQTDDILRWDGGAFVPVNFIGLSEVSQDTTPQLGGNLDLNGNIITNNDPTKDFILSSTYSAPNYPALKYQFDGVDIFSIDYNGDTGNVDISAGGGINFTTTITSAFVRNLDTTSILIGDSIYGVRLNYNPASDNGLSIRNPADDDYMSINTDKINLYGGQIFFENGNYLLGNSVYDSGMYEAGGSWVSPTDFAVGGPTNPESATPKSWVETNFEQIYTATLTTTTSTPTNIATITNGTNFATVEARVTGVDTTNGETFMSKLFGGIDQNGLVGSPSSQETYTTNAQTWDVDYVYTTSQLNIQVTGTDSNSIDWTVQYKITKD